jgi:carbonic anhydrase
MHRAALDALADEARLDRLCELNVIEQAHNVCETTIVQDAWAHRQALDVHAWIYGLTDGRLRDLGFRPDGSAPSRRQSAAQRPVERRDR